MKFEEPKKKEAIDILKNSLQYATDDKEKRSILQFIQIYENQIDYGNAVNQSSRGGSVLSNNKNIEMNFESHVKEDSEFKDNFE